MIYNLGRVVPLFKGTYDAATTYTFLDVVFYDNSSFVALDTTTGNLPTDTTHWLPVALKGLTQDPTEEQMTTIISTVETYLTGNIVDNLNSSVADKPLSANMGKEVKEYTDTFVMVGADNTLKSQQIRCIGGHIYKLYLSNTTPNWSNITYTGANYDLFAIVNSDENNENNEYLYQRGCNAKTAPLEDSYTVETVKSGYLKIWCRANEGETNLIKVVDITDTADLIGAGVYDLAKVLIPKKGELIYDGKYISSSRTSNSGIISKNYIGGNYTTYSTVNASTVKVYKIPIDAEKYAMWIPCFYGKKYDSDSGQMPAALLVDENDKIVAFSCNMYGNGGAITGTIIPKTAKYMIVPYYTSTSYIQHIYLIPRRKTTPVGTVQYRKFQTYSASTAGAVDVEFPILCGLVSNDNGTVLKQATSGSLSAKPSIYRCLSTAYDTSGTAGKVAFQIAYVEGYDRAVFNAGYSNYYNYTWCVNENGYIIDYINTIPSTETIEYKIPPEVKFIVVPCYTSSYEANQYFTLIKEDKQDEEANMVYDGLGFTRNMSLSERGSEIKANGFCTTDFIDLSQGFNMTVNDGFRMYRCLLYYGNGELANPYYMPWTDEFTGSGMANVGYRCYSTGCVMPGFKMRVIFGRDKNIYTGNSRYNPIQLDEYPFKTYTNLSDRRLTKVVPDDKPYETFKNRLNALTLCQVIPVSDQWVADNDNHSKSIPTSGTGNKYWNCRFRKGWVENAIPYSEASEYSYYVGQNVSLITYITSVLNKRSVMYTERINPSVSSGTTAYNTSITASFGSDISHYGYNGHYHNLSNTYASSFYGTVCTGLTGYLLGQRNIWISGDYQKLNGDGNGPRIPNLNTLITEGGFTCRVLSSDAEPTQAQYDDIIDSLQPMDFIWNKGHCSAVADIYKDEYGHTQFICWAEQTQPTTMIRVYSRQDFIDRLSYTHNGRHIGWAIMRYSDWEHADLTDYWGDTKIVPSDYYKFQKNIHLDPDITTFRGEYACFKTGDYTDGLNDYRAFLNIHRGGENGYNYLEIFNEDDDETVDEPERSIPISNTTTFPSDNYYSEDAYEKEDWILFNLNNTNHIGTRLSAGLYKARLKNTHDSDNIVYSGFTHFEMVSMTLNLTDITTNSSNVSTITVNWTCSDNATAYLYRAERSTGMYQTSGDENTNTVSSRDGYSIVYEINGTSGSDRKAGFTSANPYVKLFVRGTYGTQVLKKNYLGSGGGSGSGSGTPDEPEQ